MAAPRSGGLQTVTNNLNANEVPVYGDGAQLDTFREITSGTLEEVTAGGLADSTRLRRPLIDRSLKELKKSLILILSKNYF